MENISSWGYEEVGVHSRDITKIPNSQILTRRLTDDPYIPLGL